jgi:hypothetical protein
MKANPARENFSQFSILNEKHQEFSEHKAI